MHAEASIQQAREAKRHLQETVADRPWFRGVGLVRCNEGWAVRLSVARSSLDRDEAPPTECLGVPVQIVFIEGYKKR